MKAYRAHRLAGLEMLALEEVGDLQPPAGAVAIAVKAVGVHLADLAALAGERTPRPALPFTPGLEVSGTVAALGAGVKGLKKGQRVAAFVPWGGLAEQALTPAELCVALPDGVDDKVAASLPLGFAGAIVALRERAGLQPGETVLVLGAGGPAGMAAVQAAKLLGAKVIAAAGGEARLALASGQGADHLVDTAADPIDTRVLEFTSGKGADVIFDPVGGDAFEAALGTTAVGARIVSAGFAGGRVPMANVGMIFARNLTLVAANLPLIAQSHPAMARAALADAVKWAAEDRIQPRIAAQFAFADARQAFDYVRQRRGNGSVVVTL
jgi:NADPH:quinone reductase